MVQQVNLCLPILRKQKTRFGALALLQALAVVLVAILSGHILSFMVN